MWITLVKNHKRGQKESRFAKNRETAILILMAKLIKIKKLKRKRKHGFLKRAKTRTGRQVLKRRIKKGRKRIAV